MNHLQETLRPTSWNQLMGLEKSVIGTKTQKEVLIKLATNGHVRILMFIGPPGTGKTSAARIYASEYLGVPYSDITAATIDVNSGTPYYKEINASGERGIDVIRDLAADYISIPTDNDKCRVLVFDEADGLTYQAQEALKAVTQDYAYNCIFIFCLNKMYRMDEAIISRSAIFYFDPIPVEICSKWLISQAPKFDINISPQIAEKVVRYYRGDLRRVVNNFLDVYRGNEITAFNPRPTYAEQIFKAKDPAEKYYELASKEFIDAEALISELLILNDKKNPAIFGQSILMLSKADPTIAVLYALTGLVKK